MTLGMGFLGGPLPWAAGSGAFHLRAPAFSGAQVDARCARSISTGLLILDSTPARASVPDCGPFPWPSPTWADLGLASRVGFLLAAEILRGCLRSGGESFLGGSRVAPCPCRSPPPPPKGGATLERQGTSLDSLEDTSSGVLYS